MFQLSAVIIAPKKSKEEVAQLVELEEFCKLRAAAIDFATKYDVEGMAFEFKDHVGEQTAMYDCHGRRV